ETAQLEQQASLEALARGGLPLSAEQRLRELEAGEDALFASDLSVSEFALMHASGVTPIAQVMGSSIYHVGWQQQGSGWGWQAGGVSQELSVLSEAWNEARSRAFGRLEQEARLVGADAVVGVQLQIGRHDWAAGAIEYVAIGTAVRAPGPSVGDRPALTDLSRQDYWKLQRAGYGPPGLVGASPVFYVMTGFSH